MECLDGQELMEKPCTEPGSRASPVLRHRLRAAPAECGGQDLCPQTRLLEAARPSRFRRQPLLRGGLRGASQGPAHFSPSSRASAARGICCFCSWHSFPHLRVTMPRFSGEDGKEPQPGPSLFGSGETDISHLPLLWSFDPQQPEHGPAPPQGVDERMDTVSSATETIEGFCVCVCYIGNQP